MATDTFRHFLLMLMNTETSFGKPGACLDREWLSHRLDLFRRYCLPSVLNQSSTNFTWLLFTHEQTPEEIRNEFLRLVDSISNARVVWCTKFNQITLRTAIWKELTSKISHIITTRMDNDDAIAPTFIETIQKQFNGQKAEFVNFPIGYKHHLGKLYRQNNMASPFCSFIENRRGFRTVYSTSHRQIADVAPVKQVRTDPLWMSVIHDKNAINTVTGKRTLAENIGKEFRFLNLNKPKESIFEVLADVCRYYLWSFQRKLRRWMNESARSLHE